MTKSMSLLNEPVVHFEQISSIFPSLKGDLKKSSFHPLGLEVKNEDLNQF
jgi:hypothetical protein